MSYGIAERGFFAHQYVFGQPVALKSVTEQILAFSVTVILVYFIKRLAIDYAWTIAIAAGALADMMILLVGDLVFDTNGSIAMLIVGTIVSVLAAKVV